MNKPRNNIAKLNFDTRMRLAQLLDDGAGYDEVRADADISAECGLHGLALHNNSFLAYRKSAEYREFCANRREWKENLERERISSEILRGSAGIESIANVAQMEALRKLKDLLGSGELDPRDLTRVINALKAVNNASKDKKIIELEAKIADLRAKLAAQAKHIRKLAAKVGPASAAATIEAVDKYVKGE